MVTCIPVGAAQIIDGKRAHSVFHISTGDIEIVGGIFGLIILNSAFWIPYSWRSPWPPFLVLF
jgi:hypothetical protein